MNNVLKIFVLILCFSLSSQLQAQFLKKLGERVEERVKETTSRKVEDKAAEKTDKVLDKVLSPQSNRQQRDNQRSSRNGDNDSDTQSNEDQEVDVDGMLQGILGGGGKVEFEDKYTFAFTATMQVTDFTEQNEMMTTQQSYSNEAALTQLPQGLALVDYRTESVVMIDESSKTGQAMSLSWMQRMIKNQEMEQPADEEIRKTGRTKKIAGYTCHEYVMTSNDGKTIAWISQRVNFDYKEFLNSFGNMFGTDLSEVEAGQGYPMQITHYDTTGKKAYEMIVTDVSTDPRVIDMDDYEITTLF